MLAAMAGFTIEDAFIKQLSSTLSIGQILMVVGLCSSVFFALLALKSGRNIFSRHHPRARLTCSHLSASIHVVS